MQRNDFPIGTIITFPGGSAVEIKEEWFYGCDGPYSKTPEQIDSTVVTTQEKI